MTWFLWTILVLMALSVLGNLIWLASGDFPPRKPKEAAIDVCINVALVVWAVVLLGRA